MPLKRSADRQPAQHKLELTGAQATLLLTLHAKAVDSRSQRSLLHDATAAKILDAIDFDFTRIKAQGGPLTVVRALHYDEWVRKFVAALPDAVIVYLGCGLDTRVTRITPPDTVSWFDVDYPDVISLRRNFYSDGEGYTMIGASITDPAWLPHVPTDRPTMIIAEGCLEYLAPEDVKELLNRLIAYFSRGRIALDILSSFAVRRGQKALADTLGATHRWAVDDVREVDAIDPKLKRLAAISVFTSPFVRQLPFGERALCGLASLAPNFRNMLRVLLYEF